MIAPSDWCHSRHGNLKFENTARKRERQCVGAVEVSGRIAKLGGSGVGRFFGFAKSAVGFLEGGGGDTERSVKKRTEGAETRKTTFETGFGYRMPTTLQ